MDYTQNMCDREGNLIEPTSIGMPAEFPRDVGPSLPPATFG